MKTILVIEDNPENLYLSRFILEQNGYKVISAETGLAGVDLALAKKPDLILMDIQLPDINGLEATRRIRSAPEGSDLIIVALTSYAMQGDRDKALKAGCTGYIEKPINPDTFLAQMAEHFHPLADDSKEI